MTDGQRLALLEAWVEGNGYHVETDPDNPCFVDLSDRVIWLKKGETLRRRLYSLLHECGHVLQEESKAPRLFDESRLWELEDEMDAWRRGWNLQEQLDLGLPLRGYRRIATECVMTYVEHEAKKDEKKDTCHENAST
jgi:hypothetical protein